MPVVTPNDDATPTMSIVRPSVHFGRKAGSSQGLFTQYTRKSLPVTGHVTLSGVSTCEYAASRGNLTSNASRGSSVSAGVCVRRVPRRVRGHAARARLADPFHYPTRR